MPQLRSNQLKMIEIVHMLPFVDPDIELTTLPAYEPTTKHPRGYDVTRRADGETMVRIPMQVGPVPEAGINGLQAQHLLAIAADWLKQLNVAPHGNRETSLAITHLETALMWLHLRQMEREARKVEGTRLP